MFVRNIINECYLQFFTNLMSMNFLLFIVLFRMKIAVFKVGFIETECFPKAYILNPNRLGGSITKGLLQIVLNVHFMNLILICVDKFINLSKWYQVKQTYILLVVPLWCLKKHISDIMCILFGVLVAVLSFGYPSQVGVIQIFIGTL